VIGQFANTYLVCQNQRGLILIDQHAAHERILFERLKRQFASQTIPVQPSLMTEIIELEKEAVETLTVPKNAAELQKLGFDLEPMSQDSVALRSRPLFLVDQPIKPLLEKLAEEFFERGSMGVLQDKLDHVFATMACHGAIRAGRTLNQEEMENLLEQMDEFAFSSFCPHGRPVHFQMTLTEIEKEFKRIL
jgi:DNA mismatch repair protein MutL